MIILRRLTVAQYKGIQALDLAFPPRGSFLIEGRNEAGKSTLFDAVHFALYGVPLVGDLAAALHYGAEQMEVRLALEVGGTQLSVWRRTRQTAKTLRGDAELRLKRPAPVGAEGEDEEVVRGAQAVSQRLQLELGGLTAEALLNSCLVAQKQLGRLETLTRASREEALTILLNLGKLSDVLARLRPRPADEEALRVARARVELASASGELDVLAGERAALERRRRLIRLRDGLATLDSLQGASDEAREEIGTIAAQLDAIRARQTGIDGLKAVRARWQQVLDLARQAGAAEQERLILEQQAAEARAAAAALPLARATLERFQAARSQAQTLVDHQARLRLVTSEAEQIATRLREREQLSARSARLAGEVDRLRREHRATTAQINQLTPLVAERESIAVRLAALEGLQRRSSAVEEARRVLEDLEGQLAERVEVDFRHQEAQAALDAARRGLEALETQRRQVEAHRRLQARRAALQRWQAARAASEAATMARRLLDDLALAVSGVEHIAVRLQSESPAPGPRRKVKEDAGETAGLRLTLLLDHPLTGAQALSLRLWAGGAELVETRPATANEVSGLQAGKLPSLNTGDAGALAAELQLATAALEALGEGLPAGAADAGARLAEVEAALRQAPPPFDEEAYLQARTEVMSAERALREAAAAGATLPPAASIKRELARRRQALGAEVEACLAEASALRLRATDVDDLRDELAVIIPLQRERYDELGAVAGRRDAFQGQLAGLQRMGKELSRQLEECRQSLAADADDALQARLDALVAEQAQISAEATRLYAAVSAAVEHLPAAALAGARRDPGAVTVLASAHRGYGRPTGETNGKLPADAPLDEGGERIAEPPVPPVQVPADGIPDVTALRQALQEQCDLAGGQVAVLEGQSAALPDVEARLEGAAASLATQREALVTALAEARGAMAAVGTRLDASAAPVAQTESPAATALLAERQLAVLDVELRDLDEPAVRRQEQAAERELWSAEERLRRTQEEGQRLAEGLTALLAELGHPMPAPVAEEEPGPGAWATRLRAVCPEASPEDAGGLGSWEETELILANVQKREWDATQRIHSARLSLGDEPPMDLEAARQALAALELDLAARRRSQEIITHTRQRMIGKVLPDTMRNMCLLLPRLTAGRYRYAELTPDYRLQVWDERKRGYVEKNLYSGGTQDQFSLALRLGFALAALPRELGTSPGFLFLDEPLSSFDHDRTAALIDLLTHGQIATFFQQVFLISHSQAFDPGRFSHHIVMEEGCVQSSTLSPISE